MRHFFVKRNLVIFLFFIGALVSSIALFPVFNILNKYVAGQSVDSEIANIEQAHKNEEDYLLLQAKKLSVNSTIHKNITSRNSLNLLDITNKQARDLSVDTIVITDRNGIVLSRGDSGRRGDYIFNTTAWGPQLAEGKSISSIERGGVKPLIEIGAYPIKEGGKLLGVIALENIINDDFAEKFRSKYLSPGSEIAYYTKEGEIVANSLKNTDAASVLSFYLNSSGKIDKQGNQIRLQPLRLAGNYFNLSSITLRESDGKRLGAILILTPSQPMTAGIIMATIITALFLFLTVLWLRYEAKEKTKKTDFYVTPLSLILFSIVFIFAQTKIKNEALVLSAPPFTIYNSTMNFEPDFNIINKFFEQKVSIVVVPGGEAINAVTARVEYDPKAINIKEIITDDSWCDQNLFIEKTIDNADGKVDISCLLPNPGFSGSKGVVADLTIQPLRTGQFDLRFGDDTKVLANDGLGTNVLRRTDNGSYQVFGEPSPKTDPLIVFSSSHPNNARYYSNKKMSFSWLKKDGAIFQYALNKLPDFVPDREPTTTRNTAVIYAAENGIQYFHLLETKDGNPVDLAHYKVMLDFIPPPPPIIEASSHEIRAGEVVRFTLQNTDSSSSTQPGFYIKINNDLFLPVRSPLSVPFITPGKYQITVRVFDKAGNSSDSVTTINVK